MTTHRSSDLVSLVNRKESKLVKCNRALTRARSMIDDLNEAIVSKDAQATADAQKLESAQARIRQLESACRDKDVRRPFDCLLLYD